MENLSQPRQASKGSHAAVTRRTCNGSKFAGKTAYDDVFGGPPRFGAPTLSPRPEDYSEIFGGFHASRITSIPVLDLPLVDEEEVFFDVRSSGFDYGEVFGGLDGIDFAASFEELVRQYDGGSDRDHDFDGDLNGDPSDEAWTPAETESLSEDSDHSGKNQYSLNGDSYEPINSSMEFNISYHKGHHRSNRDLSHGITHVIPEYAYVVDKTTPLERTENKNPPYFESDDGSLDFTTEMMKGKHLRKTMSHPPKGTASQQTFTGDLESQRGYRRVGSHSNEMFVTISEISLKTQPSELPPPARPPPLLDVNNKDHQKSQTTTKRGTTGDSSPPFFDVEIDASSAAAVSAAAMKEAMEKAQAKLKSAKEIMERKRDGATSHLKPVSKYDGKDKKEKFSKAVDGSSGIKVERVQITSGKDGSGMKSSVRQETQKVKKTAQALSDSLEGENFFDVAIGSLDEKHGKESQTSQASDKVDGPDEWQEATEFFELVRTDKSKVTFDQAEHDIVLMKNTRTHEHQQKAKMSTKETLEQRQDNDKRVKEEEYRLQKTDNYLKTAKEAYKREGSAQKSEGAKETCSHKGSETKVRVVEKLNEHEDMKDEKKSRMAPHLENSKKPTGVDESEKIETRVKPQNKGSENKVKVAEKVNERGDIKDEKKSRIAVPSENRKKPTGVDQSEKHVKPQQKENKCVVELAMKTEKQQEEAKESMESQRKTKESQEREDNDKRYGVVFEWQEDDTKFGQAPEEAGNEERLKQALELEEKEIWLKEIREREQNEKKEREACELEESEMIWRKALEQLENEKSLKQACVQEENEKIHREALEQEGVQKKQREAHLKEENEKRSKQAPEQDVIMKQQEGYGREETEKRLKETLKMEEIEKGVNEACQSEETENRIEQDHHEKEKTEKRLEEAFEQEYHSKTLKCDQDGEHETKEAFEQEEAEEPKRGNEGQLQPEKDENVKKIKINEATHQHVQVEDIREFDRVDKNIRGNATQLASNHDSCDELEKTQETVLEENVKMQTECGDGENQAETTIGNVDGKFDMPGVVQVNLECAEKQIRMEDVMGLHHPDDITKKGGEAGVSNERYVERVNSVSKMDSGNEIQRSKFAYEMRGRGKHIEAHDALNEEEHNKKFMSDQVANNSVETERKREAAQSSTFEGKGNNQRTAQQVKVSQSTVRKGKESNGSLTTEEKETERVKRERDLEMERLRKLEEEREREREREKDRMGVDRLTLDARERVHAEARERGERAAVERAITEARERLEKACAEARDKSSTEARLRAERAAVERATAEARERAVERAMAERTAFEARERVERSVSDKFSSFSRNTGMGTSSSSSEPKVQQFQSTGSFNGSRYPYSSAYNGVEGESAQRYKARLERYRRTAERAARALAEKNMRDLIAQREQAERNRLAETLDADVKRWSSGKEGNLRALLSTLQYILGPESGWQPIPLTEVITSAAVKKAYRKATLCVHPDKLQQRGASIQQKYICEKVFDLLKEAWNKFNSEER